MECKNNMLKIFILIDNIGYILYNNHRNTKKTMIMPVISRFYGIVIKMYFRQKEHNPPHIHAIYGEYLGMFSIEDGKMFNGDMPQKGQVLIEDFINHYRDHLLQMWETQNFEVLPPIE